MNFDIKFCGMFRNISNASLEGKILPLGISFSFPNFFFFPSLPCADLFCIKQSPPQNLTLDVEFDAYPELEDHEAICVVDGMFPPIRVIYQNPNCKNFGRKV